MWDKLLSSKRFGDNFKVIEDKNNEYYRSSFHIDYDRLIFCNSFRRLSKKTQVHPLSKNDHIHNRLTHSLEVASVGRTLGLRIGELLLKKNIDINPYDIAYIIQTACLAHDIGNPPFGHAGEEVIKEWFSKNANSELLEDLSSDELNDFLHLDGNAGSFRIVNALENYSFDGGLRLTFATLGTLVKYPYSSNNCERLGKSKFNYFKSEERYFNIIFSELGLKDDNKILRHPLSYLMEAADDICYGLLDIADGVELGILRLEDLYPLFELLYSKERVEMFKSKIEMNDKQKLSLFIAKSMNNLVDEVINSFEKNYDDIMGLNQPKDIISLFENQNLKDGIALTKTIGSNKLYNERRKIELELGAYNIIETLLNNLISATYELYSKDNLSFRNKRALELMGSDRPIKGNNLFNMYQRVVDYIVGMTDNYAAYLANQLNGTGY